MSVGRRSVLALLAGGLVAGCGRTSPPAPTASPSRQARPLPPAPSGPPRSPSRRSRPVADRAEVVARFGRAVPATWGFHAPGVLTRLPTSERVVALTFDACGGPHGSGYDAALIDLLRRREVPATLFLNSRWIRANPAVFRRLAREPLFEIANHGTRHLPLSVTGRSAYGIPGTRNAGEVYDEVAGNRALLTSLLGHPPRYFRPGTAYCDDVAARIVTALGERFTGFDVNGDAGATFTPAQVHSALLTARPGSVVISHMNHPRGGTARGYAMALPDLAARGYRFVHLSHGRTRA